MTPLDARVAAFVAEVRRDWERVVTQLSTAQSADLAKSVAEAALVALSLDHAYQAFETLMVRLERALGLPERTGAGWHVQLLVDCGYPVPALRPAVYPAEAAREWDALLRFRHCLRHANAVALEPEKLKVNVARLGVAVAKTDGNIKALITALGGGG